MRGKFRYTGNISRLSNEVAKAVSNNKELRKKIDNFLAEEIQYLTENSPVGATRLLRSSWEATKSRKASNMYSYITFSIRNDSLNSINRIGGREPGKMPPLEPIRAWALAVLGDASAAFPIARKIATVGTERYKKNKNWVGVDYTDNIIPGGRVDTFAKRLLEYIQNN